MIDTHVTITWLADRAGISRQRVHKLIAGGKLAAVDFHGRWMIRTDVARAFIEARAARHVELSGDLFEDGSKAAAGGAVA